MFYFQAKKKKKAQKKFELKSKKKKNITESSPTDYRGSKLQTHGFSKKKKTTKGLKQT